MIAKYPPEGGTWDKAGEAVDVEQAFDCSHADIVTEFWSRARRIFSGFLQGIRTLKGKSHPLKITKSLKSGTRLSAITCLYFRTSQRLNTIGVKPTQRGRTSEPRGWKRRSPSHPFNVCCPS